MNILTQAAAILVTVALSSSSVLNTASKDPGTFELLILHNNDMHARFEQTSQLSGACTTADREAGKCYGGFPRVATVVKEARQAAAEGRGPPVLYLNAGDTYTGTAWFTIYKWKIAAEFVNALKPDAVSLGNNELERGTNKLSPFLDNIDTTILACNVILRSEDGNQKIQKSKVFDVEGVKVGVVGYLTLESKILDSVGNIEYIDEIVALKDEVAKLKAENVNIIIALGHADYYKDVEIATEVPGLDFVIGGVQNKYYWNGSRFDDGLFDVKRSTVAIQKSGKGVPVVQSFSYNEYLGKIKLSFDSNGKLLKYDEVPILLDNSVTQDVEATKIIQEYTEEITLTSDDEIGDTAVLLDGDSCKTEECNFGNLITDAIVYYNAINLEGDEIWTNSPIAIIHSGAIAASISPSNRPASVSKDDLLTALPIESNLVIVTMNGAILKQLIEHSASHYSSSRPTGQFLQYSGIRVVYDLSREPGSRVVSAFARCGDCYVPDFYTIDDWRTYKVLMPAALADGEYGYSMLSDQEKEVLSYDEITCTEEFIRRRSPVYPEVAGRVILQNDVDDDENEDGSEENEDETEEIVDESGESEEDSDEENSAVSLKFTLTVLVIALLSLIMS